MSIFIPIGGGGQEGPEGPQGPEGPPGPPGASALQFLPPNWAWLDSVTTKGTQVPFDLADWIQPIAGSLTPITLVPSLGDSGRYIYVAAGAAGYGAFIRPQIFGDGGNWVALIQPIFSVATLATSTSVEIQAAAFETGAAATKWFGAGPRWASQAILATPTLVTRGNGTALTGISSSTLVGSEASVSGVVASQPMAIRLRRASGVLEAFVAEAWSGWKPIATSAVPNFNAALTTIHVGVRVSVPSAMGFIIWAENYYADGALPE